jgi:hypothetical protein
MSTPFVYGKLARSENFTDREKETATLIRNFDSLVNTIIISPRRWGKSSLVAKAAEIADSATLRVCRIDLFNVRDEEHFYELLAHSVLKATSSKWEEAVETVKKFFTRLVPKIVIAGEVQNEISLDFDWDELKNNPDEVLDLAEKIAAEKGIKIVVCVDEFQNIAEFDDPLYFQKKLRSHWQQHSHVAYCLYGSKRHMMLDVFTNSSMPFYKFGDLMFLEKIDTPSWIGFIEKKFGETGKSISKEGVELICALADNHPYYVQQLSQQAWLRTDRQCSDEIIRQAHESIVAQLSLLFVTITEGLTAYQTNFLCAIIAGETALSSSEVLSTYRLGNSSNVSRARRSLVEKDILDDVGGTLSFQDPMYRHWLDNYYFA